MAAIANEQNYEQEYQTFWVPPLEPIKAQDIALPPPDQIGITVIQPLIACFKTTPEFDEQIFITAVQRATAGLIWEIPALSGRIDWEDEARHRLKCTIPENAKAQVRIKHIPHFNAEDLEAQHWPPHLFFHADLCLAPGPTFGIGTYNFGVQANIIQGGVLLVLHLNHTILDGSAQCVMASIFAHHLSTAMARRAPTASGLMPPEALDKSRAHGSHPARPILEWKDWKQSPKLTAEEATAAMIQRMSKLTFTVWHISKEKQQKLRRDMQQPNKPRLSLAVNISTWLWKVTARARGHGPDVVTRCLMPVQTRGRIKEMHPNHTGSALVYGRAKATVAELRSIGDHALGARINDSVAWWTPARIREFWGSIEDCDNIANYTNNTARDFGTDMEFSNINNFPFYKLDWGRGLQIEAWRFPTVAFTDGWVVVLPQRRDGGTEFLMYMARETIQNMMKDPEFTNYADYWCGSDPKLAEQAAGCLRAKARL